MIGLSAGRLRAYLRAGVLSPEKGARGELRFSFQDLLLRTAEGLVGPRVSPQGVRAALKKLRARLPDAQPLTGVQLGTDGQEVVVREGGARWQVDSGQVLLAFEGAPQTETPVAPLPARTPEPADAAGPGRPDLVPLSVEEIYDIGCDLDEADPEHAAASYREVIERAPQHADAHINLGRILHERGDLPGAEKHYRAALETRPLDATALFNLGVALEDQERHPEALEAYQQAITADARNADAHYNAARLYDLLGDYAAALRHLRICRDLARKQR